MNKVEETIFMKALTALHRAGYIITAVDDGGDSLVNVSDPFAAKEAAEAVESCAVFFKNAAGERAGIWFIWGDGNEGLDCLSDCTTNVSGHLDFIDDWIRYATKTTLARLLNMGYDEDDLERSNPFNRG